jgi:hypothetical protein
LKTTLFKAASVLGLAAGLLVTGLRLIGCPFAAAVAALTSAVVVLMLALAAALWPPTPPGDMRS